MSGSVSNADLAGHLEALRRDQRAAGAELQRLAGEVRRLADQHNDHERRLKELEPLKEGYRSLIECNDHLVHEIRSLKEGQRDLMDEMAARVERSLRTDLLEMRRELRTELARLAEILEKHVGGR